MSVREWAKKEVEIACQREKDNSKNGESDYIIMCYKSALKALESLVEDNHSGFSINITKDILNRLIGGKPLTPIEDTDDVWDEVSGGGNETTYQCKRMSSLFKYVSHAGTVRYRDIDAHICIDINDQSNTFYSGLTEDIANEVCPVAMPYSPNGKVKIYCEDFSTDPAKGGDDTRGVLYATMPDGKKVTINRFFKEKYGEMVEISADEYEERILYSKILKRN